MRFKVEDMTCDHCVTTIERTIKSLDAAAVVKSDLATKIVDVTSSTDADAIQIALDGAGYEAKAA